MFFNSRSVAAQVNACLIRAGQLTRNRISAVVSAIVSQVIISLIIGSIYFGTPDTTSGLYSKASALYIAILFNALQAVGEVGGLYVQRPIVAKQAGYGFCHPFADSLASIVLNLPIKLIGAVFFNIVLYFLAGLRMELARFFIYFLLVVVAQQTVCIKWDMVVQYGLTKM
jgi:ABC-type multidrug transport system permease subunit